MILTYQPSGKLNPLVLTFSIGAGVAMIGLGFVYQKLLSWIPLIYLNALLVFGYAMAGGFMMQFAVKKGKCRNPMAAKVLGLVVGVVAILSTHRFAYQFALDEAIPEIMAEDPTVTEAELRAEITFDHYVEVRVEEGWSIGKPGRSGSGLPLKGIFVYIVWLIEAGAVVWWTCVGANKMSQVPFIEAGDVWADQTEVVVRLAGQTLASKADLSEAGTLEQLIALPTANTAAPGSTYTIYELAKSDAYPDEAYLTVALEELSYDKEGKLQAKRDVIWPHIIVTPKDVDALRASAEKIGSDGRLIVPEADADAQQVPPEFAALERAVDETPDGPRPSAG